MSRQRIGMPDGTTMNENSTYETTKTGSCGEQRESMLHSELQILVCFFFNYYYR